MSSLQLSWCAPRVRSQLMSAAAILGLCGLAHGATFTVDDVADAVDAVPGDGICQTVAGVCSLRAAIQEANALPGADRIECLDKLTGTVTLAIPGAGEDLGATGDLDIRDDLTIDGDCERQRDDIVAPLHV